MSEKQNLVNCYAVGQNPWVDVAHIHGPDVLDSVLEILGQHMDPDRRTIYAPRAADFWEHLKRGVIRAEVTARYNGANAEELMIEYGLTPKQFKRCWSQSSKLRDRSGMRMRACSPRVKNAR